MCARGIHRRFWQKTTMVAGLCIALSAIIVACTSNSQYAARYEVGEARPRAEMYTQNEMLHSPANGEYEWADADGSGG